MNLLLHFLGKWEPLWLFGFLFVGLVAESFSAYMSWKEFVYDKEFNERIRAKRRKKYDFETLNDGEAK